MATWETMRQLLLLRHAKSSWDDPGLSDHARPLNARGRRAAAAMAAQRFVALLNEKWKVASAGTPQQAAPVQTVAVTVPFRSLGQWNAIRAQLLSVQGVAQIDVTTIASGGARIRLGFTSDFGELKQSLAVVGMKLVDIKGAWVLQPL